MLEGVQAVLAETRDAVHGLRDDVALMQQALGQLLARQSARTNTANVCAENGTA